MEQQVNLHQPILGARKNLFSARAIGVALAVLTLSLGSLAAFAGWRNARLEHSLTALEQQQQAELALSEHAGAAIRPGRTLQELDADARTLTADIASRERALDVIRQGDAAQARGFAARLVALAHARMDGLWLRRIVLAEGAGQLALQGAAVDPHLVPEYLAALAREPALAGVDLDRLTLRRAAQEDAPAASTFEVSAPGLEFAAKDAP